MEVTKGYEGSETYLETALAIRGVTEEEHNTKMHNLSELAKDGYRVIKMLDHDKYEVEGRKGRKGTYNPYTDSWHTYCTLKDYT